MQLGRLKAFVSYLHSLESDIAHLAPVVHRRFNGKWFSENGSEISDRVVVQRLDTSPFSSVGESTAEVFVWMRKIQAVVELTFGNAPRERTRLAAFDNIKSCLRHASDSFDATHDSLTNLLNRNGLDPLIRAAVARLRDTAKEKAPSAEAGIRGQDVAC